MKLTDKYFIACKVFLITVFLHLGCNRNKCPEIYFEPHQIIQNYHQLYQPLNKKVEIDPHLAIYLDYSSGMMVAFSNNQSALFYEMFINSLKISSADFYEVDKFDVVKIDNLSKSDLYLKIKDKKRFSGVNAPLNKAVADIVAKNSEAVFITDGELWENMERDDPWAREEFGKWLKAGNAIDFFVTDHTDAGKQKHVFYMFFIPKGQINNKDNYANQFRFYLNNSSEASGLAYSQFSFSTNTYKLIAEYKTATSGGVNENAGLDETTYIKGDSFEYIDIMMKWKDIVKYIYNALDDNGNNVAGGDPFISHLFIETSKLEFYTIEQLGIKVYDITADFKKFTLVNEISANKPSFIRDENSNIMLDENNKPIVDCPGHVDGYNEFGELITDSIFNTNSALPVLSEVFDFDNVAFINNFKQQGRGEAIIKFHKNFDGSQISSDNENFFRIDIYLEKVQVNTGNPNLEKFIWQGKQVAKNRSIYNSILGALNEANPQGQVIYTYYVRTLPFSK